MKPEHLSQNHTQGKCVDMEVISKNQEGKCGIEIWKNVETIGKNQLEIIIFLDPNYVRLKDI